MYTAGPPAGGVCNACGAVGEGYYPTPRYDPRDPLRIGRCEPLPNLTEEDVRRIIREELERAKRT